MIGSVMWAFFVGDVAPHDIMCVQPSLLTSL